MLTAELPTGMFLPYFVRFLKENTAVRFVLQKYAFFFFPIFFIFYFLFIIIFLNYTGSEIGYTHYLNVMKTWSEFLNNNVQDCTREHLKPVCFQGP